ncbi:MAG: hypothetical protein H6707_15330 [Deltaproteobacteria bacterium]|nr:hypothetical protein [Deltaproteobacteria bacterium]
MSVLIDLSLVFVLLLLLLLGMATIWLAFSAIGAKVSGWRRLAARYRCRTPKIDAAWQQLARLRVGNVIFKQGFRALACDRGLCLVPWFGERMFCKPLLLPWSAIDQPVAVPLADYLKPAGGLAGAAAALLIGAAEKAIRRGIAKHPELHNVKFTVDDHAGSSVEFELIIDLDHVADYLSLPHSPQRRPR